MSNTWITPTALARMSLATLYNSSVMLPLVTRDYDEAFAGKVGDTVGVQVPPTFTAQDFSQALGISIQNITNTKVDVKLDQHKDVSVALTSKDYTLSMQSFQDQVMTPAMEALSQAVDTALLGLRDDVTASVTAAAYNASTNPHPTFDLVDAGRTLTVAKVPLTGRAAVVDPYIAAQWRRDELMNAADKVGDNGSALRSGSLGRAHGFDNIESNNISDWTGVAFHPSAFAFVTRPLALPQGASNAAYATFKGLTIRVIIDYDVTYKQDVASFDILYGVKTMDKNRACLIEGLADSV